MPFWDAKKWLSIPEAQRPVSPFDETHLESANYLLAIGDEIYVSEEASKGKIRKLGPAESFAIDPGQFAFLLTEEMINVPLKTIGFISIRASIKFLGLVNVSGFHVDPGYHGKLIFAVFNAGPTRIHLKRGDRIFMLWLADLHNDAVGRATESYTAIPSSVVTRISGNFTTAYQVQKQVEELRKDITDLKSFKLYAMVIIGIVIVFLIPTLKDNFFRIFQNPPQVQAPTISPVPPPPIAPGPPPAKSDK